MGQFGQIGGEVGHFTGYGLKGFPLSRWRGVHLVSIPSGFPPKLDHTYWAFKAPSGNPLSPLGLSSQSGSRTGVPPFGVLRDVSQHGGVAYLSAPP